LVQYQKAPLVAWTYLAYAVYCEYIISPGLPNVMDEYIRSY